MERNSFSLHTLLRKGGESGLVGRDRLGRQGGETFC